MKGLSVIFFTENMQNHTELIKLLENTAELYVCSYSSESWADIDFYSNKNALFILDAIPETTDADWIISKLYDDKLFNTVPVLFVDFDVLYDFESKGYFAAVCDVLPQTFSYPLIRHRVDNIFEIYNSKQQIQSITKIHTRRILDQANKLKEQEGKLHTMNYELIEILVAAIESRDLELGQHIKRIRYFAKALTDVVAVNCPEYNITKDVAEYIFYGSSVHDIGKIAIPDSILLKRDRLNKNEFDIMKTHATRGARLLEMLDGVNNTDSEYFRYCKEICLNHHERWDGNGYPHGKKGDDIPISAQIVSVCDCYDALTSERPYKKMFSHDEAVEMIFNGCCGVFSPQLLKCFSLCLSEFSRICNEFSDDKNSDENLVYDYYKSVESVESSDKDIVPTSDGDNFILNSLGVVFEADLKNDVFSVLHGNMKEFFRYVPKNYAELLIYCKNACHPSDISVFTRHLTLESLKAMYSSKRTKTQVEFRLISDGKERIVSGFIKLKGDENGLTDIYGVFDSFSDDEYYSDIQTVSGNREINGGLMNEASIKEELESIFVNSKKKGIFIFIDIDDMSKINNVFGYEYGNELIREFSFKLKALSNEKISVARVGSDKFILYYNKIERQSEIIVFIKKLHNLLKKSYKTSTDSGTFTVTMGISRFPDDGITYKQLIQSARYAARAAKLTGKGTYSFFNENMKSSAEFNLCDTENSKKEYKSYVPHFSPVVDAATGNIVCYDFLPDSSVGDVLPQISESYYDLNKDSDTAKNISMISIKSVLYMFMGLRNQGYSVPPVCVYTLFSADDFSGLIQELSMFTSENDCNGLDVCILLPQDILEQTTKPKLASYSDTLKDLGFKIGLYLIGNRYIHNNCYCDNIFDRYVLTYKIYENAISMGKDFATVINELKILKNSVRILSLPYEISDEVKNDILDGGLSEFTYSLSSIKGTHNLLKDYNLRTKYIPFSNSAYKTRITEFDAKTYMIDCSKGKTAFISFNLKENRLSFSKNINRILGFDVFSSIEQKESFEFFDLFRPSDTERLKNLIDDAKSTLNNHQLPEIGIVSNKSFTEFYDYDAYLRCITNDEGIPSRLYFEITRTV